MHGISQSYTAYLKTGHEHQLICPLLTLSPLPVISIPHLVDERNEVHHGVILDVLLCKLRLRARSHAHERACASSPVRLTGDQPRPHKDTAAPCRFPLPRALFFVAGFEFCEKAELDADKGRFATTATIGDAFSWFPGL